ncbi:hypothetical protein ACVNP1_12755 [Staphylococcus aureus]
MVHSSYQLPEVANEEWLIAQKPIVKYGEIVAAPVLALSLSFDHIKSCVCECTLSH